MKTCGDCPTFLETIEDGGVCGDCRSGLYRKKTHPSCSTRNREIDLQSELARVKEEVPCGRCLGTGKDHPFRIESEPYPKCPHCHGTGKKYPESKP